MEDLDSLLRRQHGLVSRDQLRGLGVSARAITARASRGWRLVLPHVVAVGLFAPPTQHQRRVAALLEAGDVGVLTGHHACAVHGLTSAQQQGPVEVLVPRNQASRTVAFVRIRRTARMPRSVVRGGLPVAERARAVVDAARSSRALNDVRAVVIEAVQRNLVPVERLERELVAGPRRGSRLVRLALDDARQGAWSAPEAELLRLCGTSSVLPGLLMNPQLWAGSRRLVTPDGWFDDVGMAVMVHSRAHHLREADWQGTVERDNELTAHGIVVVAVTPASIRRSPQKVLATIEQAYLAARDRPRPAVRVVPRRS
ncbi:MAG TPA: type IV toxin-antitoxin system AbiEi family antitoxin domain-containing protein [Actinomycetales bacterium]|nr:type IV toxin-antitoxin system AbiEi family antitoxin domain-containing protein [Actinomycetales bacterium]